jgi:hypothetical protein
MSEQEKCWSEPEPIRHLGVGKRLNSVDVVEGVCGISDYGYFFDTEQNKHINIRLHATRNSSQSMNDLNSFDNVSGVYSVSGDYRLRKPPNIDATKMKPQTLILSCHYPKYFVYLAGTSALLCGAIGIFAMGLRNRK